MLGRVRHWDPPQLPGMSGLGADKAGERMDLVKALSNEVVGVIRDLVRMNPLFREQTQYFTSRVDMGNPYKLADFAAALTTASGPELQAVLEEQDAAERLRKALDLIVKEREVRRSSFNSPTRRGCVSFNLHLCFIFARTSPLRCQSCRRR
jgi:hypothetical protein